MKASMACLGLEPGAVGWKVQSNSLSYGGTLKKIWSNKISTTYFRQLRGRAQVRKQADQADVRPEDHRQVKVRREGLWFSGRKIFG